MSNPQKYISALTSTTRQPDMAQKKLKMTPNNHKIKKTENKKSNKMKVISLHE